jgi:hypothetical protein
MKPWHDVYWIGGSPCSGKSSIAEILAHKHGFVVYHGDDHFYDHVAAADPDSQPRLHRLREFTWEALFMRPVAEQVADEIAIYHEEFDPILEDLRELRGESRLIVEGAALLPGRVAPLLPDSSHAIFVIPSGPFQRATYAERSWPEDILAGCRDPEQAWSNWMTRDEQFGRYVAAEANALSLAVLHVDGSGSLEQNARVVAGHFALDQVSPPGP